MSVVVVEQDLVTACGRGVDACWQGLMTGQPMFSPVRRFSTDPFQSRVAALVPGLDPGADDSLVMQMLRPLLDSLAGKLPAQTLVILATTTGEADLLERNLLGGKEDENAGRWDRLLERITTLLGGQEPGLMISAACASSSAAVAHGAMLIASGQRESVLVVACDAVTEFVFSGFSALMALDPDGARPFDRSRKGLTIGEAAGYVLLMSGEHARREGRPTCGEVAGWGMTCDAHHMTGSSRDGIPLASAIRTAMKKAGLENTAPGSISAHGTGTVYNDAMEMKAFRRALGESPIPVYSLKGCIGHTMGTAGLADLSMALKSLKEKIA
ncbi:MAG: beta-ketoacyl synthase N-terminal-like domain-containing protein, partial [Lentisphaerota bacterium]